MSTDDTRTGEVAAEEVELDAMDEQTLQIARVLAAHGWEWGDGLDMLCCDCGWSMDAYIDHEDGLPERDGEKAGYDGREIAVIIRHRTHIADTILASDWLADHDARVRAEVITAEKDVAVVAIERAQLVGDRAAVEAGERHWWYAEALERGHQMSLAKRERDKLRTERDVLAQAIHDGRGILGFDNDGDKKPHTSDYVQYAQFWVADAREHRKDYDDLGDELDAATTERDRLAAGVRELAERFESHDRPRTAHKFAVAHDLRALLGPADDDERRADG